ncbi:unnamed protein product [Heligmosomoides polygyrus]|uniref:Uncharacterized protein n=1 Tax=Heligmosomoides polygyrus TaxID=6339 RepID=A0A183GPE4_HELPZ|nr:unnamed protein product [Heligmosomoides polygyrus]
MRSLQGNDTNLTERTTSILKDIEARQLEDDEANSRKRWKNKKKMGLLWNSRARHVQLTMREYWTGEIYAEAYLARVKFSVQHGIMLSSACARSSYDDDVTSAYFLFYLLTPDGCGATMGTHLLDSGTQKRPRRRCVKQEAALPLLQQHLMFKSECDPSS